MRRALAALAVLVSTLLVSPAHAADGDSRPCVSKNEANLIFDDPLWEGRTKHAIETPWEVKGLGIIYEQETTATEIAYWYPTCQARTELRVTYNRATKVWVFAFWAWTPPGSPLVSDSPYWTPKGQH